MHSGYTPCCDVIAQCSLPSTLSPHTLDARNSCDNASVDVASSCAAWLCVTSSSGVEGASGIGRSESRVLQRFRLRWQRRAKPTVQLLSCRRSLTSSRCDVSPDATSDLIPLTQCDAESIGERDLEQWDADDCFDTCQQEGVHGTTDAEFRALSEDRFRSSTVEARAEVEVEADAGSGCCEVEPLYDTSHPPRCGTPYESTDLDSCCSDLDSCFVVLDASTSCGSDVSVFVSASKAFDRSSNSSCSCGSRRASVETSFELSEAESGRSGDDVSDEDVHNMSVEEYIQKELKTVIGLA